MKTPKTSFTTLVFLICVVLFQNPAGAQSNNASELKAIKSYTAEINRFTKGKSKPRVFGDVASAFTEKTSRWREFKNEDELEMAGTGENLNGRAFIWTRNGRVVAANFTFTSPSGDWAHLMDYYFREDGFLAKIHAQLNTFYGEISVIREQYYDAAGKILKSTRKYLDLQTRKPKKPGEFFDNPVPIYRKVTDLPFSKLL